MVNKIEIIKNEDQKISNWMGGSTREILIFPRKSDYNKRNFKWRISSATINLNQSKFTYLKGIKRIIMILDGQITLKHEGHYQKILKKFEKDEFSGEWNTNSVGTGEDFNLMMDKDCSGNLEKITILKNGIEEFVIDNTKYKDLYNSFAEVFYVIEGKINISLKGSKKNFYISEKDAAVINLKTCDEKTILKIDGDYLGKSEIIMCKICFNI